MLHPSDRSLYTDALTPPRGYIFDQAIGTTYTLDPITLLTIPVHLGLAVRRKGVEADPVDLLGRFTVSLIELRSTRSVDVYRFQTANIDCLAYLNQ